MQKIYEGPGTVLRTEDKEKHNTFFAIQGVSVKGQNKMQYKNWNTVH